MKSAGRAGVRIGALVLGLLPAPAPAGACALELVLAVDVSGSIDSREFDLQTNGLADAFENPSLIAAIGELEGGVLVTMTHWSGSTRHRQMTAWHWLTDARSMAAFAAEARGTRRAWRNYSTAVGEALVHAAEVSTTAPETCKRRVIDVSGDGVSNEGREPSTISGTLAALGYTINGLVIRGAAPDPVTYFQAQVIAGPGAFVEIAADFADYPRAILRKLLREIDQPLILSDAKGGGAVRAKDGVGATALKGIHPLLPSESCSFRLYVERSLGDYGDKRARNKRLGPGGGTRRLHQKTRHWREAGPKQDRRTSKGVSFCSAGCHRYRPEQYSCQ